ncbi:unnamed protein product [Effrenium voratum]|uniref:JmjC domain-containing protein n=1 Tax=Effrenium voratum TaxID=2562239 RepID=A0AA36IXH2_9DINO|nr:unnamed protein product [Effrenium voratum]
MCAAKHGKSRRGRHIAREGKSQLRAGYRGFCPLEAGPSIVGGGGQVARRTWASLKPEEFFEFVNQRRPLIISTEGEPHGALGALFGLKGEAAKWALPGSEGAEAMQRSAAARCEVVVERRRSSSSFFGQSDDRSREKTRLGQFCKELEAGSELGYLTTQALEDDDGTPRALAAPHVLKLLEGCATLRPKLLGNLVPVQYNMWFGRSTTGSSSGLHHDFHDNIYVLLRGRKEFRLFSPRCLDILSPVGVQKAKLHDNGLISYVPGLRSDGASASALRRTASAGTSEDEEAELEELLNDALEDEEPGADTLPDSFCRGSTVPGSPEPIPESLRGRHLVADLGVGDLLYLPASWFHEVVSQGGGPGGHLALNLWMAPPRADATMLEPYEDGLWEELFQRLKPSLPREAPGRPGTGKRRKTRNHLVKVPFSHRRRLLRALHRSRAEAG